MRGSVPHTVGRRQVSTRRNRAVIVDDRYSRSALQELLQAYLPDT